MKKQILCALSVAALAATMLTVPVYAADTITVEAETSKPAYVDGHNPTGGTSWCVNNIPTNDGSITALDFNVMMTNSTGAVANDCITAHAGGIKIEYSVDIENAGDYDMSINMAGYVEDTEASSYFLPVKLKVDGNAEFRLACQGNGGYHDGGKNQTLTNQPTATIEKIGTIDVTGAGSTPNYQNHKGFYNVYKLLEPVTLNQGQNTITFILDMPPGRGYSGAVNSRGKFSLDKFVLTPVEPEPEVTEPSVQELQTFGTYEPSNGTAEFTAEGLKLDDLSKLVFGYKDKPEIVDVATYKYIKVPTTVTGTGSVNLAVRLTGIPDTVSDIKLGVADFEVE